MATQEQRQEATKAWTFLSRKCDSEEDVRMAVGMFLTQMKCPSDASKVSTLTTAVMGVAPNVEEEIKCLLGLLYASGSGSSASPRIEASTHRSIDAWSKRFNAPFDDPAGRIVQYFRAKLDRCVSQFYSIPSYWYAPYVAIVQSSGWGKSRVIKEMASEDKGVLVFYFSLMADESMGYPQADQEIRERLLSVTTLGDAYAIFCACLLWLFKQDQWPNTAKFFEQQQTLQWPPDLKQGILNGEECTSEDMKKAFKSIWEKFARQAGASILFVVDEARQLLQLQARPEKEEARDTAFTLLRRACQDFTWNTKAGSGALLVVIDTLGKVSNLAPRPPYDPSARVSRKGEELLNPISAIPTFNLLEQAKENTLEAVSEHLRLFSRGRPLWSASLKFEADNDTKLRELLELAKFKLRGGRGLSEFIKEPISSLALLGRRIGVLLCPQDRCVEELVASHMHVCLYISRSREFMLTLVPPEPVLAEAARTLVRSSRIEHQQLRHLNSCMLKGLVSAGERGELVGRFLLLNAMDDVLEDGLVKPVYMKDFLMKLTKGTWKGFGAGSENLDKAKVFFNAFYPYFGKKVTFEMLQQYLRNAGAIICRQGQRAYDVYIPIVFEDYDLSKPASVSYIAVQIKNRKEFMNSQEIIQNMSNEASWIARSDDGVQPSFCILLQLRSNKPEPELHEITSSQGMLGIALDGLKGINHDSEWDETLSALLRERPDPKSIIRSYDAEVMDVDAVSNILQDLQEPEPPYQNVAVSNILQDLQEPEPPYQKEPAETAGQQSKATGKKRRKKKHQ